ncbi:MAG: aldehyde dehydrogenase family protein [Planctomycetota bacterium]|nr:aldehyde dehydrogenase family protein [Planctomycetota bacterium]
MSSHPSLQRGPADLVAGQWRQLSSGANTLTSRNPARPTHTIWSGAPVLSHAAEAARAARDAGREWSRWPLEKRIGVLREFQKICAARLDAITMLIRDETGKVSWDAKGEAGLLGPKVDITLDQSAEGAMRRVTGLELDLGGTKRGRSWFRPHGVMAVLGPFNFPMHLPNGHIVPALAMGNTIVLKPSDKTPACGQLLGELYQAALEAAGAPRGVVNVVQGGADVAKALIASDDVDGILFTGSWPVGRRILEANLDRPGRIVALEMGGNNAAVILPDADLKQAVIECVRCAFITSGQRCTCTRRVIVHESVASKVIPAICKAASALIIGDPAATHPVFMGPVINADAQRGILDAQARFVAAGAEALVPATASDAGTGGSYVTPGVLRVDAFRADDEGGGCDVEVFGPLLRISVVKNLDDAIAQANATRYGLAASIFTRDQNAIDRFLHEAKAGCVNINCGTAGASSKLPFGGLGLSGNHRPAGSFSLDYCAYPVAGMLEGGAAFTQAAGMQFEDAWLA